VYEDLTRPRNDPYANGEYSGYMHAMRDVKSQMERVKWAIERAKAGGQAAEPPVTPTLDRLMELCSNRKSEMRKMTRIANLKTDLVENRKEE
jgi:molybdenum-dependent DNA-binding transcriptional regulator ModE